MYHRFHAPHDCRVEQVIYVSGDTWNVNPIALKRIERLFCKNERAVVRTKLTASGDPVTLVAVAAILVASIRLNCLDVVLNLRHRGPNVIACDARYRKGDELGRFEHGSTIIVFAPEGFALCDNVREGATIRVGEPLMRLPELTCRLRLCYQRVVELSGARIGRAGADALPILLEGRPFFDGLEHQAKADLRADIDIGGGELVADQIIARDTASSSAFMTRSKLPYR